MERPVIQREGIILYGISFEDLELVYLRLVEMDPQQTRWKSSLYVGWMISFFLPKHGTGR